MQRILKLQNCERAWRVGLGADKKPVLSSSGAYYPTNPFTILELQKPLHDVPVQQKIRRSPDLEALK